ncbi:RES family NAD+ phosphorylase [Ideonella sp. A 288]|uniref:RES family NAD+ phosphorylase n=1 Tax=Ideonella sp. A 288 TaxID=1962181 RepID=UPI0013035916|nr:RES family NAD+ phosphorylase [Ideonella sp. A 288]
MLLRLPEAGTFETLLRPVRIEGGSLVRLSRYPATEHFWSSGIRRFDDPDPGRVGEFGTCYTAGSIEIAFAESVIHESGRFVDGAHEVPAAELTGRSVVRFACDRRKTLVLADLTGAALKALGLNNDISASADYAVSQAWAQAIHDADPQWQGIRHVSRQMNKGFACAIFERSGLRRLRVEKLERGQVGAPCDQFNVTAV